MPLLVKPKSQSSEHAEEEETENVQITEIFLEEELIELSKNKEMKWKNRIMDIKNCVYKVKFQYYINPNGLQ